MHYLLMLRSKELSNGLDTKTTRIDSPFHHRGTELSQRDTEKSSVNLCESSVVKGLVAALLLQVKLLPLFCLA